MTMGKAVSTVATGLGGPGAAGDRVRCESPNACVDEVRADARARGGDSYSRCACTKLPGSECDAESGERRSDIELGAAEENLMESSP